jgi:ABC-type transporter Mla subunit MlaD
MNENTNEIELALRDGMIDELLETTQKSTALIARFANIVEEQDKQIQQWERLNKHLIKTVDKLINERNNLIADLDAARETAVRLEQECHACTDTVHHGNEDRY